MNNTPLKHQPSAEAPVCGQVGPSEDIGQFGSHPQVLHLPRPKVLVVDDNTSILLMLKRALRTICDVSTATDGAGALKAVKELQPQLILLDVNLPDATGYDVCVALKSDPALSAIPVIFVTGNTSAADEQRGFEIGAVDFIRKPLSASAVKARVQAHLNLKANRDSLALRVEESDDEVRRSRDAIIAGMAILAESRDAETGAHVLRTQQYVRALVEALYVSHPETLSHVDINLIAQSAALHDIGKVSIPDDILLKRGALTEVEFEVIKGHSVAGADVIRRTEQLLGPNSFLSIAARIAEFHHEKWDGSGYPHGLVGEEIPVEARIMALADVYDALRSARPYKAAFSHKETGDIILNGDGRTMPSHFWQPALDAFTMVESAFSGIRDAMEGVLHNLGKPDTRRGARDSRSAQKIDI